MPGIEPSKAETDVKKSLLVYIGCFAALWLAALAIVCIQSKVFHRGFPYDTILSPPASQFTDFTIFYPRLLLYGNPEAFYSSSGYPFTYPAPLLVCFLFLWRLLKEPLAVFLVSSCAFACLTGWDGLRSLRSHRRLRRVAGVAVVSAAIFSYPLLFLLDRANIEGIVWIAATLGLFCFTRRLYYSAAILLGLAASMKIFPALMFLLFLAKRRHREFAFSILSCAAFSVGSLWLLGPSISRAFQGIQTGMEFLHYEQLVQFRKEIRFDHSLFALIKWIDKGFLHDLARVNAILPKLYIPYGLFAASAFIALYVLRLRKMPLLNQVMALTAISVTLPFISYEYTLVHLIAPFLLLIFVLLRDAASGRVILNRAQILALTVPFALIFSPIPIMLAGDVGIGGQIKTVALIYLISVTLQIRLPSSLFGELNNDLESASFEESSRRELTDHVDRERLAGFHLEPAGEID